MLLSDIFLLIIWSFFLPGLLLPLDFLKYAIQGKRLFGGFMARMLDLIAIAGAPFFYLWMMDEKRNDCCGDSATFAPGHKLTIYIWVSLCVIACLYSMFRKKISTPVMEVIINALLLFGFVFNIFAAIQIYKAYSVLTLIGSAPIGIVLTYQLAENHKQIVGSFPPPVGAPAGRIEKIALAILGQKAFLKFPLLLILCLPLLFIVTGILLLFGQKPDSLIRAFTDTYKHGFSELDHLCDNVACGGHFLCSVAANGHTRLVKPVRYGERNGGRIICNRQLLIANAFEELLQQKMPGLHQVIRRQYNRVGNTIHRHYHFFSNKAVSDIVYILTKPLEAAFLLVLYTFDRQPETRIAVQYLSRADRMRLGK